MYYTPDFINLLTKKTVVNMITRNIQIQIKPLQSPISYSTYEFLSDTNVANDLEIFSSQNGHAIFKRRIMSGLSSFTCTSNNTFQWQRAYVNNYNHPRFGFTRPTNRLSRLMKNAVQKSGFPMITKYVSHGSPTVGVPLSFLDAP